MRKHFRLLSVVAGTALWALAVTAIMPGPATGADRGPPPGDLQCLSKDGDTQSVDDGVPVLIVYTVTVKATGKDATDVVVTDILPAGATFNAASSSDFCSNGAGPVTCDIGDLAKNTEASVMIAIDITPVLFTDVVNVASVAGTSENSNTDNDGGDGSPCEDRITPAPVGQALLVCLGKTATPSVVDEGVSTNVLYEVEIQNQGDTTATNVTVTDTFTIPMDVTAVGANADCGLEDTDPFMSGESFVCALGNLAATASATASATFNIANPQAGEVYENDAFGSADDADDTVEECSAQVTVRVGTGDQGCTPGYWKNHLTSWVPTEFDPMDGLSTAPSTMAPACVGVFQPFGNGNGHNWWTCDLDEGRMTDGVPNANPDDLLNGLGFGGGCGPTERCDKPGAARNLLRAAVAGILNASHPDVAYTMSAAEIIASVEGVIATKDRNNMLALAALIDTDNNLGCPLNNTQNDN